MTTFEIGKTLTFREDNGEVKTRRINIYDNCENVSVDHYSMAPTLRAANVA